jgi:short chain dehydrogenase
MAIWEVTPVQTSFLIPVMWVSLVATRATPPIDRQQHHPCRNDIIAVCLSSAFHTTKAALPTMLERKWGRIINTGVRICMTACSYRPHAAVQM